jgi:hypothetical protein
MKEENSTVTDLIEEGKSTVADLIHCPKEKEKFRD